MPFIPLDEQECLKVRRRDARGSLAGNKLLAFIGLDINSSVSRVKCS